MSPSSFASSAAANAARARTKARSATSMEPGMPRFSATLTCNITNSCQHTCMSSRISDSCKDRNNSKSSEMLRRMQGKWRCPAKQPNYYKPVTKRLITHSSGHDAKHRKDQHTPRRAPPHHLAACFPPLGTAAAAPASEPPLQIWQTCSFAAPL